MRYRTVGDWFFPYDHELSIQVADTGNWRFNLLVAIHELVEVFLCTDKGISQESVDRFDLTHEEDADPGSHPQAPYHDQHMVALGMEIVLSAQLGIKWRLYEQALEQTFNDTPRRTHAMSGGKKPAGRVGKGLKNLKLKTSKQSKRDKQAVKE